MDKDIVMWIIIAIQAVICLIEFFWDTDPDKDMDLQNVDLNDSRDKAYALPSSDATALQQMQNAAECNAEAAGRVELTAEWLAQIGSLISAAYTICRNADAPPYDPSASAYPYFEMLYYRSFKVGKQLEDAEKDVGRKVRSLRRIRFSRHSAEERKQIIALQKALSALDSLLCQEKNEVWNTVHHLRSVIKKCGQEGNSWYWERMIRKIKHSK